MYYLIGSEISLFTAKARAYMKWKGIAFGEVFSSVSVYKTILRPFTSLTMIPDLVIKAPDNTFRVIQDTKAIIDYFEQQDAEANGWRCENIYPQSADLKFASMLMELLGDEPMLMQAMLWRWGEGIFDQQKGFLAFEFGDNSTGGGKAPDDMIRGAAKGLAQFSAFLAPLGVTPTTTPLLKAQFHHLLKLLSTHFARYPYLLGPEISIADFSLFGSFSAHLLRDPVPGFIIKTTAPLVNEWIERVAGLGRWAGWSNVVLKTEGNKLLEVIKTYESVREGVEVEELPETSRKIIKFFLRDYAPILRSSVERTLAHIDKKTAASRTDAVPLPRGIGWGEYVLTDIETGETIKEQRAFNTHCVWMLQRIIDRTNAGSGLSWLGDDWTAAIAKWEKSGWKIERDLKNRLIARRGPSAMI